MMTNTERRKRGNMSVLHKCVERKKSGIIEYVYSTYVLLVPVYLYWGKHYRALATSPSLTQSHVLHIMCSRPRLWNNHRMFRNKDPAIFMTHSVYYHKQKQKIWRPNIAKRSKCVNIFLIFSYYTTLGNSSSIVPVDFYHIFKIGKLLWFWWQ